MDGKETKRKEVGNYEEKVMSGKLVERWKDQRQQLSLRKETYFNYSQRFVLSVTVRLNVIPTKKIRCPRFVTATDLTFHRSKQTAECCSRMKRLITELKILLILVLMVG